MPANAIEIEEMVNHRDTETQRRHKSFTAEQ